MGSKHNIFHHVFMIFYLEFINIIWFVVGLSVFAGGFVIFKFLIEPFYEIAVGLPMMLIGLGLVLMKIHELISVIFQPKKLQSVCKFCSGS